MAGRVTRSRMKVLQKLVADHPDQYPWEAVVEEVLREDIPAPDLSRDALRAQRDWVVRGGRETPGKSLGQKSKGLLARLLVQLLVMGIFLAIFLAIALLANIRWDVDIYELKKYLLDWFPALAR